MGAAAAYAGMRVSEGNRQLIERIFDRYNRTGQPPGDSMHPDVEWRPLRDDPDFEVRRGREAVHAYLAGWGEAFDGLQAERLETVAAGEKIFVWVRITGKGRGSDLPIEQEQGVVYTVRNGRIVSGEEFSDRAQGRRAAGLEADDG